MALSIGMDYSKGTWKTCLMENGRTLELRQFNDAPATIAYLQHTAALYPDSPINELLIAIDSINFTGYSIPAVRQIPTIPAYRRRHRLDMGTSSKLCAVTALLYHMRVQEAAWQEMRFLYLDIDQNARSILVVEDGRIVNGLGETAGAYPYRAPRQAQTEHADLAEEIRESETMAEQAFWEGLTQDLAGLMAIHHLEDIVVTGPRKDTVIERFEESYQFYHFPHSDHTYVGFEAAIGAAVIAEGLYHPGLAAEIVERLQLSQAHGLQRMFAVPGGNAGGISARYSKHSLRSAGGAE